MCARTNTPPALVCTLGDLKPGQQFHDPNGETWMVLAPMTPQDYRVQFEESGTQVRDTMVVNIGNGPTNPFGMKADELKGLVTPMYASTRLGHDHAGRLYSSTKLNDWYYTPDPVPADAADPMATVAAQGAADDDAVTTDAAGA